MSMTLTLLLAVIGAVPIPNRAEGLPEPNGPAPRIQFVKADAGGEIAIGYVKHQMVNQTIVGDKETKVTQTKVTYTGTLSLRKIKDLVITTADGKVLDLDEAARIFAAGRGVAISTDGAPLDPGYLQRLGVDVLILRSPELAETVRPAPGIAENVAPKR
jgi:hypothetical protein